MFGPAGFLTFGSLADFMLKSSVVLTLALAAAVILHRKPAALRHFVLSVFLIGLLLLPILSFVPGGWRTGLLPRSRAISVYPASLPVQRVILKNASAPTGTLSHSRSRIAGAFGAGTLSHSRSRIAGAFGALAPTLREVTESLPSGAVGIDAGLSAVPDMDPTAAGRFLTRAPGNAGRFLASLFLAAWAAGCGLLLLRLGLGLAGAARLTRDGRLLTEPAWRILLARFLAAVSLRRDVRLKSHDAVAIPLTWGLIRPVILLPRGAEEWTEEERATVLCHELSHVKRGDFLVMLLVRLSLAVAWVNPLTWVVFGMLRREQEKACDEMVLRTGLKPSVYAAHLLSFRRAAGRRFQPAAALLGLFGRSPLNERLAAILKHKLVFREVKMKTKLALGCAVILAVALVGTARPAAPVEIQEVPSVAAEAAAAEPAPVAVQAPEAQAAAQASAPAAQAEKDKAKAKAEADAAKQVRVKKIRIEPAGEKGAPVEVIVTEGDTVKSLVADEPVIVIKRTEPGEEIVIASGGKEIPVGRSGDVRIEIRGAGLKVVGEDEHLTLAHGQVLAIKAGKPDVWVLKKSRTADPGDEFSVVTIEPEDKAARVFRFASRTEDLEKKLEEIREQLRQVKEKKIAIEDVEKSLEALTESLKKREAGLRTARAYAWTTKGPVTASGDARSKKAESVSIVVSSEDKEGLSLVLTTHPGKIGRERYDRTVAEIKQALPEGCTLESEFKEDSEAIVVTVKGPKLDRDKTDALLEKLIPILKKGGKKEPQAAK
jgi:beta-lactamase regulating signal transducer with metallopeptidase domain